MSVSLMNKELNNQLANALEKSAKQRDDSIQKLATGKVFTKNDPRPSERYLAEKLDFRLRSLASSKRNINDAVNLLQTAESSLTEINNIILRMKELNVAGATTTVSDQERRYMFIEFQALHDELNRIAFTTEFNGLPLLNGESDKVPEELVFRIDDPFNDEDVTDIDDVNSIRFEGLQGIVATTEGLGIQSAVELLEDSDEYEGISLEDVEELLIPEEDEIFATIYDEALNTLATQRAVFGAMQSRLHRSLDYIDVYQENIAAAKSNIADTDYAREVVKLAESSILMQATSGLMAQSNFDQNITLNLLSSVVK